MNLQLNKAHYPVTVLGYGKRIGLWFQGCSIGCKGCISRDTWTKDAGNHIEIDSVLEWCRTVSGSALDGVTISGGEPFEQHEALHQLLIGLRAWTDGLPQPVDYLCYTGLQHRAVERRYPYILQHLDLVITGSYLQELPPASLRGSSNQKLLMLTELGRERYGGLGPELEKKFQVAVDGERVWFIGVPARGDMEQLEQECRSRGLKMEGVSWRG